MTDITATPLAATLAEARRRTDAKAVDAAIADGRVIPADDGIIELPRPEGARARLRRLEAAITDDSQGALERQDAQGEVDLRNLTRAGLVMAVLSVALLVYLFA